MDMELYQDERLDIDVCKRCHYELAVKTVRNAAVPRDEIVEVLSVIVDLL